MKFVLHIFVLCTLMLLFSCSLPIERAVSVNELKRSKGIAYYIIEDAPESVLKVLNDRGEVVVKSDYFDEPVYLQIFSTPHGLEIRHFDRDDYGFED